MSTKPVKKNDDVRNSNDKHISQDFPGFPHAPSSEKNIKENKNDGVKHSIHTLNEPERSTLKNKEKKIGKKNLHMENALRSNGTASAFSATEKVEEEEKTDEDNNDLAFRKGK